MNMDGERNEENSRQQKPPGSQMAAAHHHQPPPHLKCSRCDSSNTKFCYYNNYSLSQPRYFCKACRRYWTQGGTLRNVPVGGGCRRAKRSKTSSSSSHIARSTQPLPSQSTISGQSRPQLPVAAPPTGSSLYAGGGFMSSLAAMQSLRGQGAAAMNLGGQFGANMALLQGISSFPPSKPPAAAYHQFQPQNYFFPSQQSFIQARPFSSWTTQSLIDTGGNAANSNFWGTSGAAAGDGSDLAAAGSSASPNQWSDNHPAGFNHLSQ